MSEILTYYASLINVIDGDTVDVEVSLGFDIVIQTRVRLYGVDTPEIHNTKFSSSENIKGQIEKFYVRQWFESANDPFILEVYGKGYFGRWVAVIRSAIGETSLNDELVSRGWYRAGWTRNGRPYWNPLGSEIEIKYPKGKQSLLGPDSRIIDRD